MESKNTTTQTNEKQNNATYRLEKLIGNLLLIDTSILHEAFDNLNVSPEQPHNLEGVSYRGINALLLRNAAQVNGYTSSEWGTFDQWKKASRSIKKGEKGTLMFFFIENFEDDGIEIKRNVEYTYTFLFNRCQLTPPENV
jgi:hypothetical protein